MNLYDFFLEISIAMHWKISHVVKKSNRNFHIIVYHESNTSDYKMRRVLFFK